MPATGEQVKENLRLMRSCVLNFDEGFDWDTPVYRVYPRCRLEQLFVDKKNTLVKPIMWDDPFENLVFRQKASLSTGEPVSFEVVREKYYGQCWTLNSKETDALWRIYSHDKEGVRVKTTLKRLFNGFFDPTNEYALVSYYIGKVRYNTSEEIKLYYEKPENLSNIFDSSGQGAVQTLLVKRSEFEHESEVRLIYVASSDAEMGNGQLYKYNFDPISILEELVFDPRYENSVFEELKAKFIALGFAGTIERSTMYQIPDFSLRFNPL